MGGGGNKLMNMNLNEIRMEPRPSVPMRIDLAWKILISSLCEEKKIT